MKPKLFRLDVPDEESLQIQSKPSVDHPALSPGASTIALEELERRSGVYADAMIAELAAFNTQYPVAQGLEPGPPRPLSPTEQQSLKERFREDFFLYMASQRVILPPVSGRPYLERVQRVRKVFIDEEAKQN